MNAMSLERAVAICLRLNQMNHAQCMGVASGRHGARHAADLSNER